LFRCAPPAGDEDEALLSPLEVEADAAAAGADAEELLSFIDADAEALFSRIALGADDDAEALLSVIELGAGAEADAPVPMELEAGGDEAAEPLSAIELEVCARTLEIGKPMRAASAPAANTLPVDVINALYLTLLRPP